MDTAKEKKSVTILDTIDVLETYRDQLFEFLDIPKEEAEKMPSATTTLLSARDRILQVNRHLSDVLEHLEKRRIQLQEEFGERIL